MTKKASPFFDTNVLIYAFASGDARAAVAEFLLAQGGTVGVQNLNEFVSVARRKLKMSWLEVRHALEAIQTLCPSPVPITVAVHDAAIELAARYHFQIYDALVIAAASSVSCSILYSEDLQAGQTVNGVTVRNPFHKL